MKAVTASLFVASLLLTGLAQAAAPTPPEKIDRASYPAWLAQIGAEVSAYEDFTFGWYEEQMKTALPAGVTTDPDKLVVRVDRATAEAVKLENAGDVEEGTSYGLESYAIIDAPIATVLETILFRWGKPVGAASGVTYPNDTVFGYREEHLAPEWGPNSFKTTTIKKNGGIAGDMNDVFSLLLRGNARDGYVLAGSFINALPGMTSTSTSYVTIIMIRPMADGKTEYRVAGMLSGQSYAFFGVENGRKNFGFNTAKIREGQKDFFSQVYALKSTGKIPERRP